MRPLLGELIPILGVLEHLRVPKEVIPGCRPLNPWIPGSRVSGRGADEGLGSAECTAWVAQPEAMLQRYHYGVAQPEAMLQRYHYGVAQPEAMHMHML